MQQYTPNSRFILKESLLMKPGKGHMARKLRGTQNYGIYNAYLNRDKCNLPRSVLL